MPGAEQAEKQCTRAEKRQEQKQVRAFLRQLKAVEREQRRDRETTRAQRRHVKQRQVSRACERTHKVLDWYEEEIDGYFDLLRKRRPAEWRQLRGYPRLHIDGQGWKIVAIYRIEYYTPTYDDWDWSARGYGRFLAYNVHRREVLLSEYWSRGGCPCCESVVGSMDAMKEIMDQSLGAPTESGFLASAEEFLDCAQRLVDPAMKLRRAMPEDVGYHSLVTLYAVYTLFYSRVVRQAPLSHRYERTDFGPIAAWSPREWDLAAYNALVRLQALWRGWHFRQRVLYSPHTELGRRYLLRAWNRECSSQI